MFDDLLDRKDLPIQVKAYDTTYKFGDFFLSTLTFRQTEFQEKPIMALAYLFHQRRFEREHDLFISEVVAAIPRLKTSRRCIFVTDEEPGLVNAITKNIPDSEHFRCWLHAWGNMKRKLQMLGIKELDELERIKNEFLHLLNSESETQYQNRLLALVPRWNSVHEV